MKLEAKRYVLTDEQWHRLCDAVDKSRSGTKEVKVDKEALKALLADFEASGARETP